MGIKTRLKQILKNRILKPQLRRLDAWEKIVNDHPGSVRGGENSPVRFNIPREGLKMEGDHPLLPGLPGGGGRIGTYDPRVIGPNPV